MCCKAVLVQDARPPPPSPTVKSGEARLCTVDFLEQTVAAAGFAARVTKDRIPLKALKLSLRADAWPTQPFTGRDFKEGRV